MIKLFLQILLVFFVFRLVGSLLGLFRGRSAKIGSKSDTPSRKDKAYNDLTPYEIEDAEYEELPKRD
jgi:hypothetical protein